MKKAIKITLATLVILITALIATPFLFKGKILNLLKTQINKNINATVSFDNDISLSIIKSFPSFTLGIQDLLVVGKDTFQNDTLANIENLELKMDIMSVISGSEIAIEKIYLYKPKLKIKVLKDGRANYDITIADSSAEEDDAQVDYKIALQSFVVEQGDLLYHDESLDFFMDLIQFDNTSKGDFTLSQFPLETKTEVKETNLSFGGITYLKKVETNLLADILIDLDKMYFGLKENEVSLNDMILKGDGWYQMFEDKSEMDMKFSAPEVSFKKLLSLIPDEFLKDLKGVNTSGQVAFDGYAKGTLSETQIPAFGANLMVKNGQLKYPDLPGSVKDIQLTANVKNPGGSADNTVVEVKNFHANLNQDILDAKMILKTPVSDPDFNVMAKGDINLDNLKKSIKMENQNLTGKLKADIEAKGKLSSIEKENYQDFQAKGSLSLSDFIYQSGENTEETKVQNMSFKFSPQTVTLENLEGNMGKSDFKAFGQLDNFYGYVFGEETLKGRVDFKSNYFNLNPFLSDESAQQENPKPEDTVAMEAIDIPEDLDIVLSSKINTLVYDNLKLERVSGSIQVKDKKLIMDNLKSNIFGGAININGEYNSANLESPMANMDLQLTSLNIQETFKYMEILQKLGPVSKFVEGLFTAKVNLSTSLTKNLNPKYNSLNADANIKLSEAAVNGFELLDKIGNKLNIDALKNLELRNLAFGIGIEDGKIKLKDTLNIPLQKNTLKIAGYSQLDQSLHYTGLINIPKAQLGAANTLWESFNKQAKTQGFNLDVASSIPVQMDILGTLTNPKISFNLKQAKNTIVGGIKNQIKEGIDNKKEELKENVEAKKEKFKEDINQEKEKRKAEILATADKQASAAKELAKKNAEKIKGEFYLQAKKLEEKAADKNAIEKRIAQKSAEELRKKGDKEEQRIIDEGNKTANNILKKAQEQVDKL